MVKENCLVLMVYYKRLDQGIRIFQAELILGYQKKNRWSSYNSTITFNRFLFSSYHQHFLVHLSVLIDRGMQLGTQLFIFGLKRNGQVK